MYETVVVSTVVMHFAFIAYVLAGGFLALRWRRTMWLHVPAVIWGIGIAAKRVDCPLTWVERWARTKAAMTPLSPDGFVAHYITGVIYPAGWVATCRQSGVGDTGDDVRASLDRWLARWQPRYPDVRVQSAAVHGELLDYLAGLGRSVHMVVLSASDQEHVEQLVGAPGNAVLQEAGCTLLVVGQQYL